MTVLKQDRQNSQTEKCLRPSYDLCSANITWRVPGHFHGIVCKLGCPGFRISGVERSDVWVAHLGR
jgi:hypothetical protein